MVNIQSIVSNKLSSYRTTHYFKQYAEITSVDEFRQYCEWAKTNNVKEMIIIIFESVKEINIQHN